MMIPLRKWRVTTKNPSLMFPKVAVFHRGTATVLGGMISLSIWCFQPSPRNIGLAAGAKRLILRWSSCAIDLNIDRNIYKHMHANICLDYKWKNTLNE